MSTISDNYLENVKTLFRYYKSLGDKSIAQLNDEQIHQYLVPNSNNVAIIVKHICGNMLSRWTDFLESDGEKEWRNREGEFEDTITDKKDLLAVWENAWTVLFGAIDPLTAADLSRIAYIRNEGHSVTEAINRQLGHYSYHIGQLAFIAKALKSDDWQTLSIAKGASKQFNKEKFDKDKERKNFV